MKRLMMAAAAMCAMVAGSAGALPYSVTFGEIPLANGVSFTTQYSSYDITGSNLYYYSDPRDTFDGKGVAPSAATSSITFAAPASALTVDYLSLAVYGSGIFSVFDSDSNLLDTFVVTAGSTDQNLSHTFSASNISRLILLESTNPAPGFLAISNLRFAAAAVPAPAAVPEPASWALMIGGIGLTGSALRRRKDAVRARLIAA